jgi:hypothetical protein
MRHTHHTESQFGAVCGGGFGTCSWQLACNNQQQHLLTGDHTPRMKLAMYDVVTAMRSKYERSSDM